MSSKLLNGSAFLSSIISHMCFFPTPGSSSSTCILVDSGCALLKKSTNRCSFSETICSTACSSSAFAVCVSFDGFILPLMCCILSLFPSPMYTSSYGCRNTPFFGINSSRLKWFFPIACATGFFKWIGRVSNG